MIEINYSERWFFTSCSLGAWCEAAGLLFWIASLGNTPESEKNLIGSQNNDFILHGIDFRLYIELTDEVHDQNFSIFVVEAQQIGHCLEFHSFLEFEVNVEKEMLRVLHNLSLLMMQEEIVFELNYSNTSCWMARMMDWHFSKSQSSKRALMKCTRLSSVETNLRSRMSVICWKLKFFCKSMAEIR